VPGNEPVLLVFQAGCLGMIPMTMIGKVLRMFHRQNKSVRGAPHEPVTQHD
jgi:hypothetical protein